MKDKILFKAKEIFAKKGYELASMEEIAKELDITKPAIYYHYKNKKALYNEIFKQKFSKFHFEVSGKLEEDIKNYIDTICDFFENRDFARIFLIELNMGFIHLEDDTKKIISILLKTVTEILKNTSLNPLFIQTSIISAVLMYKNTCEVRKDITEIVGVDFDIHFDLREDLKEMILNYIKAKQ
ncbi:TetR/AcrR family transcriptional regulator [Caminibacter sp.]